MRSRVRLVLLPPCLLTALLISSPAGASTSDGPRPGGAGEPPAAARLQAVAHFVGTDGKPWPQFEPTWDALRKVYGDAMPPRVTIAVFEEGGGGYFDTEHNTINLTRSYLEKMGAELVAHETSHLCLAVLTQGASATEHFRFIDEGLAEILGRRSSGRGEQYRTEVLAAAAKEARKGNVTFAKVQRWSEYFGDWQVSAGPGPSRPRNWGAYLVGASFDFFLMERYGESKFMALLADIGRSRDLDASLKQVIGRSAAEVEAAWHAWLTQRT